MPVPVIAFLLLEQLLNSTREATARANAEPDFMSILISISDSEVAGRQLLAPWNATSAEFRPGPHMTLSRKLPRVRGLFRTAKRKLEDLESERLTPIVYQEWAEKSKPAAPALIKTCGRRRCLGPDFPCSAGLQGKPDLN